MGLDTWLCYRSYGICTHGPKFRWQKRRVDLANWQVTEGWGNLLRMLHGKRKNGRRGITNHSKQSKASILRQNWAGQSKQKKKATAWTCYRRDDEIPLAPTSDSYVAQKEQKTAAVEEEHLKHDSPTLKRDSAGQGGKGKNSPLLLESIDSLFFFPLRHALSLSTRYDLYDASALPCPAFSHSQKFRPRHAIGSACRNGQPGLREILACRRHCWHRRWLSWTEAPKEARGFEFFTPCIVVTGLSAVGARRGWMDGEVHVDVTDGRCKRMATLR